MIHSVKNNSPALTAAKISQKQSQARKVVHHTPFGDVMVDKLSTTDIARAVSGKVLTSAPPSAAATSTTTATASATATATTPAAGQPDPHSIPTPQSVFGNDVWVKQPEYEAPNGTRGSYNPIYFATKETAEKIAAMVGGKVVEQKGLADSVFHQSVPNQMIELPNGARVNAGLIADFYNHGYPQYYVDMMVQAEIRGATA